MLNWLVPWKRILTLAAMLVCWTVSRPGSAIAQETEPAAQPATQGETGTEQAAAESTAAEPGSDAAQNDSLSDLQAQWAEMNATLIEKEQEFKATQDVQQQAQLRQQYLALIDQAHELIDRLKAAALTSLESDPTNAETLRLLMGILMNDAQFERADEVMRIGDLLISQDIKSRYFEVAAESERLSLSARDLFDELLIRQRETQAADLPLVRLATSKGDILIELFENQAPNTTANFIHLVENNFYDGLTFHRVIDDFMAQGGDPAGNGSGGPGYEIACECYTPEARRHYLGSISMAHAGRDTGGSQFFLAFGRSDSIKNLDGKHTVFGRIISGLDLLGQLTRTHELAGNQEVAIADVQPDKIVRAEVVRKRDHEYPLQKIGQAAAEDPAAAPENRQPPAQPGGDRPDQPLPTDAGDDPPPDQPSTTKKSDESDGQD